MASTPKKASSQDEDGMDDDQQDMSHMEQLRHAIFMVLHDMSKDTNISFTILAVFWLFDLLFVLLLPLGPSPALPWHDASVMQGIWEVIGNLWFAPGTGQYFDWLGYSWPALYAVMAAWSSCVLAVVGWLTYAHAGFSDYSPKWMSVFLRVSARLAVHALWMPLIINLVSPFSCSVSKGALWYNTPLSCWTGGHAAMVAASAILTPLVIAWHVMVALTYINREPDYSGKKNLLAAPHGRVDAAMLLLKAALAVFYVFAEGSANPLAFLLPVLVAGLAWTYIYLRFLPYHRMVLNKLQVAASFVFISACACALLAQGVGDHSAGQIGGVAWLLMLPLTLFSGWSLTDMQARQYSSGQAVRGHELELSSPFAVELRARAILAEAIASGADPRAASFAARQPDDYYNNSAGLSLLGNNKANELYSQTNPMAATAGGAGASSPSDGTVSPGPDGAMDARGNGTVAGGVTINMNATTARPGTSQGHASNNGPTALAIGGDISAGVGLYGDESRLEDARAVRDTVATLWRDASRSFSNSPMLHLFWAQFHASINLNFHLEQLKLREASDKADWSQIDVHFFTWSRALSMSQQADAAGATKMNVERRMRFERLQATSRAAVSSTREQVLAFWSELSQKHPDLTKLQALGVSINTAMFHADTMFHDLLELAPQNASVMRTYAEYLLELANDPRKAQELLSDAEQIEEDASKNHALSNARELAFATAIGDFDLSQESVGMIRVASDRDRLGIITHVNLAACRTCGYSKRELIGRSLNDLIPAPMGVVHNAFMAKFLHTGETRFLGVSRVNFILHRAGYIVPIKAHVQPSNSDFRAVIDSVPVPPGEMYVWCLGHQGGWRITAMCEQAMMTMSVDAQSLRSNTVLITQFIPNAEKVLDEAVANGSANTVLNLPVHGGNRTRSRRPSIADGRMPSGKQQANTEETRPMPIILKTQFINIAAVGQPIYIMRIRRNTRAVVTEAGGNNGGDNQAWTGVARGEGRRDASRAGSGSDAGSDSVQHGDSDREDTPRHDNEDRHRGSGAKGEGQKPGVSASASKGRPPHPMPAGADELDIGMCPVMSRPSSVEGQDTVKQGQASAGAAAQPQGHGAGQPPRHDAHPGSATKSGGTHSGAASLTDSQGRPVKSALHKPDGHGPGSMRGSRAGTPTHAHLHVKVEDSAAPITGHSHDVEAPDNVDKVVRPAVDKSGKPVGTAVVLTEHGSFSAHVHKEESGEGAILHKGTPHHANGAAQPAPAAAGHAPELPGSVPSPHVDVIDAGQAGGAEQVLPLDSARRKEFRMRIPTDHEASSDEADLPQGRRSRSATGTGDSPTEPALPAAQPRSIVAPGPVSPGPASGSGSSQQAANPLAVSTAPPPGTPVPSAGRFLGTSDGAHAGGRKGSAGPKVPALPLAEKLGQQTPQPGHDNNLHVDHPTDEREQHAAPAQAPKGRRMSNADHDHHSGYSGEHRDHGPGSVHSKGSGASGTSISEIVRRGVMSRSGQLEGSLRMVRWAVLLTFFVTAGLNIASYLVTQTLMKQVVTNLQLVYKNGLRAVLAQRLYSNTMTWRAAAIGLADPINMTAQAIRNGIYLDDFEALNQELYLAVDGALPEEEDLYTNGSALTVLDFRNGTVGMASFDMYTTTTRTLNLANGAIEMATRMRRILVMNATDITFLEPNVYWVTSNGPGSLRQGMNRSLMYADKRSSSQGDSIKLADTIVLIVAEVLFFFVIVGAMLPAVVKVARSRQAVFDVFIQVPLPIIQALRATVQKRIQAIQQAEEEADVGIDIAGQGNELDEGDDENDAEKDLQALLKQSRTALKGITNPRGSRASAKDSAADGDDGPDAELSAVVNAQANNGSGMSVLTRGLQRRKSKRRAFKNAGSSIIKMLLSFTWPVILYMIYFAVMWWYKGTVVDTAAQTRAELLWSVQSELYLRLASIRLRFALTFFDRGYVTNELALAESNLLFTESLVDSILYGSKRLNMRPGLQTNSAVFRHVWLEDACADNGDWYYTMDDCRTFHSGVMTKGLVGAFRTYSELGRTLIQWRRDAVADVGTPLPRVHIEPAGSDRDVMGQLGTKFLAEAFARVSRMQRDTAVDGLAQFQDTYASVVGITVAALAVFWLFVYRPMINKLDKDIKNVRLLLLLFPDEVARSVPVIVNAGRELLAEAGSTGGSVASHSVIHK